MEPRKFSFGVYFFMSNDSLVLLIKNKSASEASVKAVSIRNVMLKLSKHLHTIY
ncbi:hypothetical protein SAMN05880574_10920 [Chryseobacterium sp. RU37D]|nr:hypothetical protein SAMN05880574_10920 [Chryseobacterium sp. RU37D]